MNSAAELRLIKNQIESAIRKAESDKKTFEENRTKGRKIKHVICSWCNEKIEDLHYFHCDSHDKDFCDYCASWGNTERIGIIEWDRTTKGKAPSCDKAISRDCCLNKREIFE